MPPTDPARTSDPPEALRGFLRWLRDEGLLVEDHKLWNELRIKVVLEKYWGAP